MREVEHLISVIESIKKAVAAEDTLKLKDLSNRTIHSSSIEQQRGEILILVIAYTLGKLIERDYASKLKNWSLFAKKFNLSLDEAIQALKQKRFEEYEQSLIKARKTIESISPDLRPYIKEVLRKASINKASKMYEHGISMEQTAKLLGITQWEISEYTGQTKIVDVRQNISLNTRKRAQIALEFFD